MSFHGRSLDDQPLAAYSTGVKPSEEEAEPVRDPGYTSVPAPSSSTAELVAHAHDDAAAEAPAAASGRRFSLPFRLPSFGRGNRAALAAGAPFQAVALPSDVPPRPFEPVHVPTPRTDTPAGSPVRRSLAQLRQLRLRDPRVLAGGTIAVGLVLLTFSLLGGGGSNSGSNGPGSSLGTGVQPTAAPVGNASVELTSGVIGTFELAGATGGGPAVDSQLNATWTDALGHSLGIAGMASQGTRTTDANFVLTWTMLADGASVTFTSKASECTIGMAVGPKAVHGTFVCKKLRSDDGRHLVDFKGSYTT